MIGAAAVTRAALISLLLAISGCTSFAHPIAKGAPARFDVRLVGSWEGTLEDDEPDEADMQFRVVVRRDGRAIVTSPDSDSETEKASLRLTVAHFDGFDLVNVAIRDDGRTMWHPLRYEVATVDELRIFLLDDDVWFDAVTRGALPGTATRSFEGPSIWVSAPSKSLAEFVIAHRDTAFHERAVVLRRVR